MDTVNRVVNKPNYAGAVIMNLGEGRMEATWEPTDCAIPDEIEYLAERVDLPVLRTEARSAAREDDLHLLFTPEGLWRGVRCKLEVWCVFMKSQGWGEQEVNAFLESIKAVPKKILRPA